MSPEVRNLPRKVSLFESEQYHWLGDQPEIDSAEGVVLAIVGYVRGHCVYLVQSMPPPHLDSTVFGKLTDWFL